MGLTLSFWVSAMYQDLLHVGLEGFLAGLVLIIAIGSQNAYVLKCSVKNYYPYQVGLACFLGDVLLMNLGVFGLAQMLSEHSVAIQIIRWFGVVFVTAYGCFSLYNLYNMQNKAGQFRDEISDNKGHLVNPSMCKAILIAFSFTFLNPHVYLDTVLIIGNLGIRYLPEQRIFFIAGCLAASALWFFTLCTTGKLLSNFFSSLRVWQFIEFSVACIMFFIAYQLLFAL